MKWKQSLQRMILGAVLTAVAAPVVAQDRIPWITELRAAREVAERQNRLVLLHFSREDCMPCKQVERNVFNQPEFIRALTTGYIPVKIDVNQKPQLADFYNIESVPTDVIVTPEGREVQRFQSLQDPNRYIAMLDGIRAQAGVGAYEPVTPNATPVAIRPQQQSASANPYGGNPPSQPGQSRYSVVPRDGGGDAGGNPTSQPGQSRYGQADTGQASSAQPAPSASEPSHGYSQNRYANPLDQQTMPQQQELAPRYANPYAQGTAANNNSTGSRYTQPTQDYRQPSTPQTNEFADPRGPGAVDTAGTSHDWQQARGESPYGIARHQGSPSQPTQNPTAGGSAPQAGYDAGGPTQPSISQPRPNPTQPQISLEGYCPVTLVQNRVWTPGDKKWGAVHEGHVYLFAGPAQQQQFLANPQIYAPLIAGYDPVRFAETGQLVPGRREFGLYIDDPGPIALFADEAALERFHANSGYYFNRIRQAQTQQAGGVTR
ncbi:MAG: thioredoxin family protein [Pirellulaceae bacterium]